jgi:hypothetical protein
MSPADTDLLAPAYTAALMTAFQDRNARQAFHTATGRPAFRPPRTGLDTLIDRAIGNEADDAYLREFIEWFTVNHWGEEYAPDNWREMLTP